MLRLARIFPVVLVLLASASFVFAQQSRSLPGGEREEDGAPILHPWSAPPFWMPSRSAKVESQGRPSIETPTIAAPTLYSFVAITPCRQYNSLNSTPLGQAVNRPVTLTGSPCFIPSGAAAVSANITVFNIIGASGNGVFKVDTVSPPASAWINYPPTEVQRANAGTLALNGSGQIIVQVAQGAGQVDFVVDINGYYTLPPITLAAFVDSDGTFLRGLHAIGSSHTGAAGSGGYHVDFDRDITGCFWVGNNGLSAGGPPPTAFAGTALQTGTTNSLFVQTRNAAGAVADFPFSVLVHCP